MKVEELLKAGYINDETTICITAGKTKKRGNWFQDHIMDFMEEKIDNFEMDFIENEMFIIVNHQEQEAQA